VSWGRNGEIERPGWKHATIEFVRHSLIRSGIVLFVTYAGADWLVDSEVGDFLLTMALFVGVHVWMTRVE
jgi:hypothetical protein